MGSSNTNIKYLISKIETNKICYFPGETINGTAHLQAKPEFNQTEFTFPQAIIKLTEYQHYQYFEKDEKGSESYEEKEKKTLIELPISIPKSNLYEGVKMQFSFKIPEDCYPTCIFSGTDYVKHMLSLEFQSIKANYEEFYVIIKNRPTFTISNGLYQSPAILTKEITKHKLIISEGKFIAVLKLPKNSFSYGEKNIPFELSIDCKQLDLKIKGVKITLVKKTKMHYHLRHSSVRFKDKDKIELKNYDLVKGQPNYIFKDVFILPEKFNSLEQYNKFENRMMDRNSALNYLTFTSAKLFPPCKGGLFTVEYFLEIKFKIDSILSKDEKIKMPLDFYTPEDNIKNENNINLNRPSTDYKGGKINNIDRNIQNNNHINQNNLKINQQKIQGNIVGNNINNNINNLGNKNNVNVNINKNQNINNFRNQNTPLNVNNNMRLNQPINNINNINYQGQALPQNNNNKMANIKINQPANSPNNNYNNAQLINNVQNNNYNRIQPINNAYNNNYNKINPQQNLNNKYANNAVGNQIINNMNMNRNMIQYNQGLINGNQYYGQQYNK